MILIWFESFDVDKLIDWYFYHIFFFFSRRGYGLIMERDSSSKERNGDSSFRLVTWNSESVSNFLNFHVHNTHTQNAKLITLHLCFKWTWSKYLKSIPSFEDMLVPLQCNKHSGNVTALWNMYHISKCVWETQFNLLGYSYNSLNLWKCYFYDIIFNVYTPMEPLDITG